MAADKPTAAVDDRASETVDYITAHELGHGVYITHHQPDTGGGTDNCIMRYIFDEIDTHKRSANDDAAAWAAMTIPDTFCNDAPDTCRNDTQVTDAP